MDSYFTIQDLPKYVEHLRQDIVDSFESGTLSDLDSYITSSEIQSIVLDFCKEYDEYGKLIITENIDEEIFTSVSNWVFGISLAKLASQNLIECAWDDEQNIMVFWTQEDDENG